MKKREVSPIFFFYVEEENTYLFQFFQKSFRKNKERGFSKHFLAKAFKAFKCVNF